MILILVLAAGLLPFNVQFDYPGPQAGKGSVQTESGFLMAGNTALDASGNTQVIFAAYDTNGAFLFTDSFHMGVSTEIYAVQYTDEGIIFTGNWTDPSSGVNAFAYSMSSSFEKLWTYSLELDFHEAFTTAAQGADGEIVCAGSTSSSGAGGNDVLMVALDQDGNELWQKTYGTPGEEATYHISPCSDGGYILACQAMDWGAGLGDYWIIRTDSMGDTLWTGTYGGPEFDYPWRVAQFEDCFYVAGSTLSYGSGSYDWFILKLDQNGEIIWETTWGDRNTDSAMALTVRDGMAVVGGASELELNQFQSTVVIFDENGSVAEEWFYDPAMIRSIETLDNRGFLIGGVSYGSSSSLWAMCTDSLGNCPGMGIAPEIGSRGISLSRNPVFSSVKITVLDTSSIVTVCDVSGRIVGTAEISNGTALFDASGLPAGIYSIQSSCGSACRMAVLR